MSLTCTSAGVGNVPEYVCGSQEETDKLLDYFTNKAPKITKEYLLVHHDKSLVVSDAIEFSSKGIYCFDITDYKKYDQYGCIAIPEKPLNISQLPYISKK